MKVCLMALETKEGLLLLEKVVGHGSMGVVTDETVFHNGIMLKDKGSLVTGMTLKTKVIYPFVRP